MCCPQFTINNSQGGGSFFDMLSWPECLTCVAYRHCVIVHRPAHLCLSDGFCGLVILHYMLLFSAA
jgi:hypothetical protein